MVTRTDRDQLFDGAGNLLSENVVERDITVEVNRATLQAKAERALATNIDYLSQPAIPASPTVAQVTAAVRIIRTEVDALAKQVNALIRLSERLLDSVDGT